MVDGVDLQFRESRCRPLPERVFPCFSEEFPCGLSRKPPIPVWQGCQEPRKVVWEELRERTGNEKFLLVGLAHGFEPQCGAVRFESNQAERWAGVQLANIPAEVETQWFDHRLDPLAQFLEPAQSREWARRWPLPFGTTWRNRLRDRQVIRRASQ